ncbi:MAG: virulence RhuM family protein [Bacteroidales bacterium]|nr:virulence RhuM family protein [Candidatus Scybalocola fimicaballi]
MENNRKSIQIPSSDNSQIIIYQPDETLSLEVKVDQETVWLTQAQMADLFRTTRNNVTMHVNNIFKEGELEEISVSKESLRTATDGKKYRTKLYNLDVIISVGYRVKSTTGTRFRIWANKVIKDYLLQGYSINQHLVALQQQMDDRMNAIEIRQDQQQKQLDFFIQTSTPPAEMVFFNGQFFTARVAIENLIKNASTRVVIIDHYVDAKTFDLFDVRRPGVDGIIYTQGVGDGMRRLRDEHNRQSGVQPVEIKKWRVEPHDRFIIIDNFLYHCGHSLNATGGKLSAIMLMGKSPDSILAEME